MHLKSANQMCNISRSRHNTEKISHYLPSLNIQRLQRSFSWPSTKGFFPSEKVSFRKSEIVIQERLQPMEIQNKSKLVTTARSIRLKGGNCCNIVLLADLVTFRRDVESFFRWTLGNVSTIMCLCQLVVKLLNTDIFSTKRLYVGKVCPKLEKSKIFHKSKDKYKSLDFIFECNKFPVQTINSFPASSLNTYFESVCSGNSLPLDQSMSNNLLRIHSFSTFPRHVNIFTSLLSKAGFYYTGNDDEVRCYACGITHKKWMSTDDPIKIHQRLSPNCPHLTSLTNENLARADDRPQLSAATGSFTGSSNHLLNSSTLSIPTTDSTLNLNNLSREDTTFTNGQSFPSVSENESYNSASFRQPNQNAADFENGQCTPKIGSAPQTPSSNTESTSQQYAFNKTIAYTNHTNKSSSNVTTPSQNAATGFDNPQNAATGHNNPQNATTERDNPHNVQKSNGVDDLPSMGIHLDKPKYPSYAPLQVRISSYQGWPSYLDQTAHQMATAGFLFAGYQDYTRCFFCGGGLRNWEAGDDPWVEHARWFPKCTYLLQNKGLKFVRAVQEKQQQLDREQNQQISQNASNNLSLPKQHDAESSNSSNTDNHQNDSHLETVAAKSVLEMGYSNDEVLQAIQMIKTSNPGGISISATDIMNVLLNIEDEGKTAAAGNTESNPVSIPKATDSSDLSATIDSASGSTENIALDELKLDDAELLVEENRQLKDQRLCKICLEYDACIAFLPCGHLVCCSDCAPAMRKCPICRAHVKGTVKTFLV